MTVAAALRHSWKVLAVRLAVEFGLVVGLTVVVMHQLGPSVNVVDEFTGTVGIISADGTKGCVDMGSDPSRCAHFWTNNPVPGVGTDTVPVKVGDKVRVLVVDTPGDQIYVVLHALNE